MVFLYLVNDHIARRPLNSPDTQFHSPMEEQTALEIIPADIATGSGLWGRCPSRFTAPGPGNGYSANGAEDKGDGEALLAARGTSIQDRWAKLEAASVQFSQASNCPSGTASIPISQADLYAVLSAVLTNRKLRRLRILGATLCFELPVPWL